jgi:spermidine synthase
MRNNWFLDKESEHRWIFHRVKKVLLSVETKFQNVEIIDTYNFGRVIVLDNKIQSAELDEFIYHEALTHPVMIAHPNPEYILIIGGGEGAILREVLKYDSVKQVLMIDIDKEFVEICKKHLESWHRGSFFDERVTLIFADAYDYTKKIEKKFDVIIADISDPIEGGPASLIYTKEFYKSIFNILSINGIFVTQATEIFYNQVEVHSIINKTVNSVFPIAESYCDYIPSLGSMWGFVVGSRDCYLKKMSPEEIDRRMKCREIKGLKYYDPDSHIRLFGLPVRIKKLISIQNLIGSVKNPIRVYSNK